MLVVTRVSDDVKSTFFDYDEEIIINKFAEIHSLKELAEIYLHKIITRC